MIHPLTRSWSALTRNPLMILVPLAWEAVASVGLFLLSSSVAAPAQRKVTAKFLLPPAIPSGSELIGTQVPMTQAGVPFSVVLVGILFLVLSALAKAGYLHMMVGALEGAGTGWDRLIEGINRFGGRLFLWHLIIGAVVLGGALLAIPLGGAALLFIIPAIGLAIAYYLVDFLLVARDMEVTEALRESPGMLSKHFVELLPVAGASVLTSVVLSLLLSGTGLSTLWLASPLWAFFGTWVGMAVVAVLRPPKPEAASPDPPASY